MRRSDPKLINLETLAPQQRVRPSNSSGSHCWYMHSCTSHPIQLPARKTVCLLQSSPASRGDALVDTAPPPTSEAAPVLADISTPQCLPPLSVLPLRLGVCCTCQTAQSLRHGGPLAVAKALDPVVCIGGACSHCAIVQPTSREYAICTTPLRRPISCSRFISSLGQRHGSEPYSSRFAYDTLGITR